MFARTTLMRFKLLSRQGVLGRMQGRLVQAWSRTTPHGHSILPARPKFSNFTFAVGRITSDHLVSYYFFTPRVMPVSLLPCVYFKN